MIKPNLPDKSVRMCAASCDITEEIEYNLCSENINLLKVSGKMDCDIAVKNHPDLYLMHFDPDSLFFAKNICSLAGDVNINKTDINIDIPAGKVLYPRDVFFNAVSLGKILICCKRHIHPSVLEKANINGYRILDVNQGYTKCNICIVDNKSIITEDIGIAKKLSSFGFDVLLLEKHGVALSGYKYGFIGGASGKISEDKLAFFGDIKLHPEYDIIKHFLHTRGVEEVSLSRKPLYDYGSLLPLE